MYGRQGNWPAAIEDYQRAIAVSEQIDNFRGVVTAGGELAQAFLRTGELRFALEAVDKAIEANTHIPDELYLVPRNLAVKAAILAKLGESAEAEALYREGIALVNSMLQHAPTKNVQRNLVAEISDVYSGYFAFLSERRRYDHALQALEQVRGRMETEALQHHQSNTDLSPSADEQAITKLDLALLTADDPRLRSELTSKIYSAELHMGPSVLANQAATRSVHLGELQRTLPPHTLLLEYVLAEPESHVFAITSDSVSAYVLPAKNSIEADAVTYRRELREKKEDPGLAHKLFSEVLEPVKEYARKPDLVIVPDGSLHLLPFVALRDEHGYVLKSHTVDVNPSSTVFSLLSTRPTSANSNTLPYIGVAVWTDGAKSKNFLLRAIDGPEQSEMVPLPESRKEVEAIAANLPQPNAILLGADATEARFKELSPVGSDVIHLALHGYADLDYPDRSALVFAPDAANSEDGLLQVREVRALHLRAKLVTLSACNTGVGPVGQTGVENIVNAFLEAGANSVVSTLWELEDHATEHLMTHFYQGLAIHNRKVDALRLAQLEMLDQGCRPTIGRVSRSWDSHTAWCSDGDSSEG